MAYPYQSYQNPYQQGYYPVYQQPQYQQPVQQPVMQQQTQPIQQPVYSNGIIWVGNEREAEMFPVGPNAAVALWESSGKRAYMKKADATGKPTMTVYDLVERPENAADSPEKADGKTDEYARKSDLAAVVGVVKSFDELIGSLRADIDTMKGDMYGIAGKKKPKKPVEVTEDDE